jgi:hypothetical protein
MVVVMPPPSEALQNHLKQLLKRAGIDTARP